MNVALRRILLAALLLGASTWMVLRFRQARQDVGREVERDQPVVAPSRVEAANGLVTVTLDSADLGRLALSLVALRPGVGRAETRLPAEVVPETERATTLRAPVTGRLTLPDGAHWPRLGERVRAGVPIARVSDARPLAPAISGTVTRIEAQPGALVEAGQVLVEITDLSRPLVRVVWLEGAGRSPSPTLTLSATGPGGAGGSDEARVPAKLVGLAPEADPVTRRPVYLYRAARTWPGAAPGVPVIALVDPGATTTREGEAGREPGDRAASTSVLVPDSAVVQWEGLAWVYRQRGPGTFERVRVRTDRPMPGGWRAGPPLAAGDTVVLRGAEELLSEEFRARVTVGDESGE